jgi:hypothetical protein
LRHRLLRQPEPTIDYIIEINTELGHHQTHSKIVHDNDVGRPKGCSSFQLGIINWKR